MTDTEKEERELLLRRYKESGDKTLRNSIVMAYMDIVKYAAISTRNMYLKFTDAEDIVNEATIALINAIDSYVLDKEASFKTYASIKIRGAIIDYIRRQDFIPRSVRRFAKEYDAAYSELYSELDREPTTEELAAKMKMPVSKFEHCTYQMATAQTMSFEEILSDKGFDLAEGPDEEGIWSAESSVHNKERAKYLAEAIKTLKERERLVITLYYYEKMRFSDIGKVLDISESRVCQLHTQAVNRMKKYLKDYLDR